MPTLGLNPRPSPVTTQAERSPSAASTEGDSRIKAGGVASAPSTVPSHSPPPTPEVTTAASALPPGCDLPSDAFLLARFAACDTDPIALSEELKIRLDLLIDWLTAPETVKRLNAILEYRDLIAQQKQKALSDRILASFEQLYERARKNDDPVEQRRTGVALLRCSARAADRRIRFTGGRGVAGGGAPASRAGGPVPAPGGGLTLSRFPVHFRTRSRAVRTVPILHEPPAILPAPDHPDPAQSPAATTFKLLHRLQDSDNPCPGDGLRTLFNHFTDRMRREVDAPTAEEFARTDLDAYTYLLAHHSAILHPTIFPPPDYEGAPVLDALQHTDLIDLDGRLWTLSLTYRRKSAAAPWLIDDVVLNAMPAPDPGAPNSS